MFAFLLIPLIESSDTRCGEFENYGMAMIAISTHVESALRNFFLRYNGLSTIVDVLLPHGADPTLKGENGILPLHLAARRGNEEIVKVLLDRPIVHVDAKDDSGKTALHLACSEGQKKVCEILLHHGADIKAVSEDKMTPLHCAIQNCHSEVARMILDQGEIRRDTSYALSILIVIQRISFV